MRGFITDHGLGVISHRQTCDRHHLQIVGAVAHHDRLSGRNAHQCAGLLHNVSLALRIDNRPDELAGEVPVAHLEHIGAGPVESELRTQALGEKRKAA